MTPEQEMKASVIAAGECWHEWERKYLLQDYATGMFKCSKCDYSSEWVKGSPHNPSPTDLNELFRLAEKLGFTKIETDKDAKNKTFQCNISKDDYVCTYHFLIGIGNTPADALRTALYQAVKGEG